MLTYLLTDLVDVVNSICCWLPSVTWCISNDNMWHLWLK